MKMIFMLFFCLAVVPFAIGQNYHPFIRPNASWDVLHGDASICMVSNGDHYFFQGDTTIAGVQYSRVMTNSMVTVNPGPFCPPFLVNPTIVYFAGLFLREDTSAKKVFLYNPDNQEEVLVYDFSLLAGDTLKSTYVGVPQPCIVDSVGTMTLQNGQVSKVFYFPQNKYYLESVGSPYGLLPEFAMPEWEDELICMKDNGVHLWGSQCYGYVGLDEITGNPGIIIYPNPTTGLIHVDAGTKGDYEIEVYNYLGALVYHQPMTFSSLIDLQNEVSGLYMVNVIRDHHIILTQRILKLVRLGSP